MFQPYTHYCADDAQLVLGDCLDVMRQIPDGSIDAIITDLPYAVTYSAWDSIIPLAAMWEQFHRIIKPNGPIVLTASQPFTSQLVMSNFKNFRVEWIWDKVNTTGFANAKTHPLKQHESVLVFGKKKTTYNPQKTQGKPNHGQGKALRSRIADTMLIDASGATDNLTGLKYPKSIITFAKHSSQCGLHPTQKSLELMTYLVRTYSNEGETVLDCCMGSATTGVACQLTGRKFIGIEKEMRYYKVARDRMFPFAFVEDHVEPDDAPPE